MINRIVNKTVSAGKDVSRRIAARAEEAGEKASEAWENLTDAAERDGATAKVVAARRAATRMSRKVIEDLRRTGDRLRDDPRELTKAIAVSARAKVSDLGATTGAVRLGAMASSRLAEMGMLLAEESRQRFAQVRGLDVTALSRSTAAAAVSAFETLKGAFPEFNQLSQSMQAKMAMAGSRGEWRTVDVATQFYESTVPFPVRNLGESAVEAFVDGKHASHVQSVYNESGKAMDTANIVWESAGDNLSRGASNMTGSELAQVNAQNLLDATRIVAQEALQNAVLAGCIGMALEGVVSIGENLIYVYKDVRTSGDALKTVAKDVTKAGIAGAIGGFGVSAAVALGAGPALATAAPVLVTIGGTLYAISTYKRIKTALDTNGRPVDLPDVTPAG